MVFSVIDLRLHRGDAARVSSLASRGLPLMGTTRVACLLLGISALTSACATDSPSEQGTRRSAPSVSSPAASDPATGAPGTLAAPLSAADYRAAARDLARSDTGQFELSIKADRDTDDADLAVLPRVRGSWRISTSESATSTRAMSSDGPIETQNRLVDGQAFFRAAFEGSVFGADCWTEVDFAAPELAGSPLAGQQAGLPAALYLFDGYRPEGRPDAGTVRLDDGLAAVGFQKLANADPTRFQQQRLPVEVQLKDGRLHRVLIFPGDLAGALDTISGAPGADELAALLQEAPFEFWAVEYSGFGDSVVIEAPPTERLLDLDDADACDARD